MSQKKYTLPNTGKSHSTIKSPRVKKVYKCINCNRHFNPNKNEKCYFHNKAPMCDGLRTNNAYDRVIYPCCGKVQIGYDPILEKTQGCIVNDSHFLSN